MILFSQHTPFRDQRHDYNRGLCFTYQPKSPLVRGETVYTARNIDIQHANMSPENDIGHFTWFLNVLRAFLAGSELLWTLFY